MTLVISYWVELGQWLFLTIESGLVNILGLQHLWLRKQEKRELGMAESVFATDPRLLANL